MTSNAYHLGYMAIMATVVAIGLAMAVTGLKERQDKNVARASMSDILGAVGVVSETDIETIYKQTVTGIILDHTGNEIKDSGVLAMDIDVKKESKIDFAERRFPIFIYKNEDVSHCIIPVRGMGLWNEIWGYIALDDDFNTIVGVSFDHMAETPGLGAEIKDNEKWKKQFLGKKIMDNSGNFVSISIIKGKLRDQDHEINSISGATVTSTGVAEMMFEDLQGYLPYFEAHKK